MAIEDVFKNNLTGIIVGVVAAALAPVLLPAAMTVARPFAKAFVKGGMILYDKSRETVAELGEVFEDLVAEARAELEHGSAQVADAAATAAAEVAREAGS
jgi:hypothetical protein